MAPAPRTPKNEKGLEGVVVARSRLSDVDGAAGKLRYCGYEVGQLAERCCFEEVAFLLWHRRLPVKDELVALKRDIGAARDIPQPILDLMRASPRDAHPMTVLRTAVSALGAFDLDAEDLGPEALLGESTRLLGEVPMLAAAWHRIRNGKDPVKPDPKLGVAAHLLWSIHGKRPTALAEKALDAALIAHADHGMSSSTLVARTVTSTGSDIHAAIAAALGALRGPLHGCASERVMDMLIRIGSPDAARSAVEAMLGDHGRIPGFGHRIYKEHSDPRAAILESVAVRMATKAGETQWIDIARALVDIVAASKGLHPNFDLYAAPALYALKVPQDLFSSVYASARIAGWTAHVMEQASDNRLMRPSERYVGEPPRAVPGKP